jgi:hypothetical protein
MFTSYVQLKELNLRNPGSTQKKYLTMPLLVAVLLAVVTQQVDHHFLF